jgi:Zn-dependent protease/CBS domain-containing protein
MDDGTLSDILLEVAFVCLIFMCVLLHELGHALTAAKYGVRTRDITLLPIGGVANLEKMPEKPLQEFFVAIAGPMVNVVIFLLLFPFILYSNGWPDDLMGIDLSPNSFLLQVAGVNVMLVVFNLIPAFPMDGGRVLRSLLAMRMGRVKATRIAALTGQFFAVGFVIIGFFANPMLILIGVFVFLGAQGEWRAVAQDDAFQDVRVDRLISARFKVLSPTVTVREAADALLQDYATDFLVMEDGLVSGVITRDEIIRAFTDATSDQPIRNFMRIEIPQLTTLDTLSHAWSVMRSSNLPLLPVMDNGKLAGILTSENLAEYFALQWAGQKVK